MLALGVLGEVPEDNVDIELHDRREDSLSFFIAVLGPDDFASKRLGHRDDTMEAPAMSTMTLDA